METTWMECNSQSFIWEHTWHNLECTVSIVPYANCLIFAASDNKLLPDAHIHSSDRHRMEITDDIFEIGLFLNAI